MNFLKRDFSLTLFEKVNVKDLLGNLQVASLDNDLDDIVIF